MTSTITLPSGFVPAIWTQASNLFTSLSSYTEAIVGVLLALIAIEFIIGAMHK